MSVLAESGRILGSAQGSGSRACREQRHSQKVLSRLVQLVGSSRATDLPPFLCAGFSSSL